MFWVLVLCALGAGLFLTGSFFAAEASHGRRVPLENGVLAAIGTANDLSLEAIPKRGDGLLSFARRYCGTSEPARRIGDLNGGTRRLLNGVRYRIPFIELSPEYQLRVIQTLFEGDFASAKGWHHRVGQQVGPQGSAGNESLWRIAEWFTGRGENYSAIREENGFADNTLSPEQIVVVPARLLRPALRAALPPESAYYLEYGKDRDGEYALYRLKAGEALYSSVVARFTGRIYADDVNALAGQIAELNGIRDVRQIPVGYAVKIPFDLLQPEFLPASHPRRREYDAGLLASAQYTNRVTARRLAGITVILDAGHGGSDVGASQGRLWESVYVYDIMTRVKRLLEATTAATAEVTTRDGHGFEPIDRGVLPTSRGHSVQTEPSYAIQDSTVALHLRWYLANSFYRRALKEGGDPEKVVFLSIHADSLHPSLRGAMAYIPGARYRNGSFGKQGAVYAARREVREAPQVSFSRRDREKSEGLSRQLAGSLLAAFTDAGLPTHADKAIREKVIRKRREWVPAVLRYNAVPAEVLLEVCNLANADDRELIQTHAYRQQAAEAIVKGIVDYYDRGTPGSGVRVARAGR